MSESLMERITDDANLFAAWQRIRQNGGGAGVDAVRLADFEADLYTHLAQLQAQLRDDTYLPLPLRRASLPKKQGGFRNLAIPTIADRVAQRAFVNVLEPGFEAVILSCSFGYRPGRGVHDAVERVLRYRAAGLDWIVDADVQDFFASLDQTLLLDFLRQHIKERAVLRVIGLWLEGGAMQQEKPGEAVSLLARSAAQVRQAGKRLLEDADSPDAETSLTYLTKERWSDLVRRFGIEAGRMAWDCRATLLPLLASRAVPGGWRAGRWRCSRRSGCGLRPASEPERTTGGNPAGWGHQPPARQCVPA